MNLLFENAITERLRSQELSVVARLVFAYTGVLLPIVCHMMAYNGIPEGPEWQSGNFDDKIAFVLSGKAGYFFYPFMLYSMVCCCCILTTEQSVARNPFIRFGIFSGIPVALWYSIVLAAQFAEVHEPNSLRWIAAAGYVAFGFASLGGAWAIWLGIVWFWRKINGRLSYLAWGIFALGLLAALRAVITGEPEIAMLPISIPGVLFLVSLFLSAFWTLFTYTALSLRIAWLYPEPFRFSLGSMMRLVSWCAVFLSACRWSVIKSLEVYAQLPTEPPDNCYVATAAANGHPKFVGAWQQQTDGGELVTVNSQLQVLKAGEIAIRTLCPWLHRVMRQVYDRLGPSLAARISSPLLADATYVLLLLPTVVTKVILRFLLGKQTRELVEGLYRP